MRKPEILYTVAKTESGGLIQAKEAPKGEKYFCHACDGEFILRKSLAGRRRPHFAHKILSDSCTAETALHSAFKQLFFQKIVRLLRGDGDLPVKWNCSYCDQIHTGNLLKTASDVRMEYDIGVCQPDIALFDIKGNLILVIEVVVTHQPEEAAKKYYNDNGIGLVEIHLMSDQDLCIIDQDLLVPTAVNLCRNPKCAICGQYMAQMRIAIYRTICWKCRTVMNAVIAHDPYRLQGNPISLTKEEFEFARTKGVILKEQHSNIIHDKYVASTCPRCHRFIGDYYAVEQYGESNYDGSREKYLQDRKHGFKSGIYHTGYYCEECDKAVPVSPFRDITLKYDPRQPC